VIFSVREAQYDRKVVRDDPSCLVWEISEALIASMSLRSLSRQIMKRQIGLLVFRCPRIDESQHRSQLEGSACLPVDNKRQGAGLPIGIAGRGEPRCATQNQVPACRPRSHSQHRGSPALVVKPVQRHDAQDVFLLFEVLLRNSQ
jgi:hypothetical protein